MNEESLTVSELNNFIRDVLSSAFPRPVWVCGEIQGYDRGKDKKHVFFELCEKNPVSNEIVARTGLVIFANARPRIEAVLKKAENAFVLKDDIEVKFLCSVDFYPGHGQVRLIVENIDPIYTLGKIAQDRQRLINTLREKGILDKNKALPMPRVPLTIGLITSYDSAAYHDFTQELRQSGYAFRVASFNSIMQGKNTESAIVRALNVLNGMRDLDAIVITRGGGSIADLSCFDSQAIAEAIAASRLPVLSGIGHEINTTVTDLAAHTFAKTPTAVARVLIGRVQEFLMHVNEKQEELLKILERTQKEKRALLGKRAYQLQSSTNALVKGHHHRMTRFTEAIKRLPEAMVKQSHQSTAHATVRLKKTIHLHLQNSKTKMVNYTKLVDLASPAKTLKRGFSITRLENGKLIRKVSDAPKDKVLTTILYDGQISSTVIAS